MKYYKAFNHDMTCRDKQYEENTVYEENGTEICKPGMIHFCEDPFDTLEYYPLVDSEGRIGEWAEVEPLSEVIKDDRKSASSKIKIGAKLGLKGFIKACIDFTFEKTINNSKHNDFDSGNYAKIGSSGNYAKIGSSGDSAKIGSSGNYAKIGSSGNYAQIGSSGDSAKIGSSGKNSVVMCAGRYSIASAKIGSWITLAEWIEENNEFIPKCVKTEYVDGERIKEDTKYILKDGEFTIYESEE